GWLLGAGSTASASSEDPQTDAGAAAEAPTVVTIELGMIIHPVAAEFVRRSLDEADAMGAEALVIQLDTPGGLLTSTREIFTAMLGAKTPVVVYVSPSGAQAASAGFFLLMAADVAAMAPGTNTGAAHPVAGSGEEIEGVMAEKVEQDAAATIRSLAARNGRNAEMAEVAVVESRSFTADEALDVGLVDLIAAGLPELLTAIDGREVILDGDERRTLSTAGAALHTITMGPFQRILSTLAHPNIAYLLLTLGGLGLYFELSNPGAILPGVIGGICLLLAFFALSVLPVNYAGIGLIILALLFFIAEVKVTSYGLLTVAGVTSLVLGSMMLFETVDPAIRVSMDVIFTVALISLLVVAFLVTMVVRVHRTQVRTGSEGLIHERGVARGVLEPRGKVFVHGEIWDAVADARIEAGAPIEVVGVDGMLLRVRPVAETSSPPNRVAGEAASGTVSSSINGGTS
ncbi:MAG: nodulation protein NfeD, partial [Thermoanaerobaculia bacterium]|nr:nodulation protein NfeD [Thermoanaerobaculia bacterium]